MKIAEKMELLAKLARKEIKVEYQVASAWQEIWFNNDGLLVDETGFTWQAGFPYICELRIKKSIPLLSPEDLDFAEKYLPHDWWIARDEDERLFIYGRKPIRTKGRYWLNDDNFMLRNIFSFPAFSEVKWEDDDCYTVQELIDNAKK